MIRTLTSYEPLNLFVRTIDRFVRRKVDNHNFRLEIDEWYTLDVIFNRSNLETNLYNELLSDLLIRKRPRFIPRPAILRVLDLFFFYIVKVLLGLLFYVTTPFTVVRDIRSLTRTRLFTKIYQGNVSQGTLLLTHADKCVDGFDRYLGSIGNYGPVLCVCRVNDVSYRGPEQENLSHVPSPKRYSVALFRRSIPLLKKRRFATFVLLPLCIYVIYRSVGMGSSLGTSSWRLIRHVLGARLVHREIFEGQLSSIIARGVTKVVYPYENQFWEFVLCRIARRTNLEAIAVQHSIFNPLDLRLDMTPIRSAYMSMAPTEFYLNSRISDQHHVIRYPLIPKKMIQAHRYEYLRNINENFPRKCKVDSMVIMGDYSDEINKTIIEFVRSVRQLGFKVPIYFKPHPHQSNKTIRGMEQFGVRIYGRKVDLRTVLEEHEIVVTSDRSSVTFDAAFSGGRVLTLLPTARRRTRLGIGLLEQIGSKDTLLANAQNFEDVFFRTESKPSMNRMLDYVNL
jgi:hypothetical protein